MKVSEEVEDAIRNHFNRLDEDSHHWESAKPTPSILKKMYMLLTGELQNKCVCDYKNYPLYPSYKDRTETMFHVAAKHGSGYDVAIFNGKVHICKDCGAEKYVSSKRDRKYARFVTFEELGLTQ